MNRYMDMVNNVDDEPTAKQASLDIGKFFFENGIPLSCARSPSYFDMIRSIANYGPGLELPTMNEMKTWILEKEEEKTREEVVNEIKSTWRKTGVSLLLDSWSGMRNRSLINFLVNNEHGTVFLKMVDASDCVNDARKLFELVDGVVEEIGEDIVLQVITKNASTYYKEAGRLLMEKRTSLYWSPCAAHCVESMLEKIGELPQNENALLKAKRVTNFIYNHRWVLNLMRKFLKKDLVRPAATRFATAFMTLDNMHQLKEPLQRMFNSNKWSSCTWAKKDEGKAVEKIILNDDTFWHDVVYSIKTTKPLVHVMRTIVGEETPGMGFIYGAMVEAKEKIVKNFEDEEVSSYKEICNIIDQKWKKQLHHDLHAAAYFLNPRFKRSDNFSEHPEIKIGLLNCVDRFFKDRELSVKVISQIFDYIEKKGMFGFRVGYVRRPPVYWWDMVGDAFPELKSFAMKVLGLTCSTPACERNLCLYKQVDIHRRGHLNSTKLNSLLYIMYNNKLKQKYLKKKSRKEEDDPLIVEDVLSDDEWIANPIDEEDEAIKIEDEGRHSVEPRPKRQKRNQALGKGKGQNAGGLLDEDDDDVDHCFLNI